MKHDAKGMSNKDLRKSLNRGLVRLQSLEDQARAQRRDKLKARRAQQRKEGGK